MFLLLFMTSFLWGAVNPRPGRPNAYSAGFVIGASVGGRNTWKILKFLERKIWTCRFTRKVSRSGVLFLCDVCCRKLQKRYPVSEKTHHLGWAEFRWTSSSSSMPPPRRSHNVTSMLNSQFQKFDQLIRMDLWRLSAVKPAIHPPTNLRQQQRARKPVITAGELWIHRNTE